MQNIAGMPVSPVGLGCNNFGNRYDEEQSRAVIEAALDVGVNFFDTADSYGGSRSEEYLGRVLRDRREAVVIATKFGSATTDGGGGAHPAYVVEACARSLRRL